MPRIHRSTFTIGPGAATDLAELNEIDMSSFDCLEMWVKLTTADTDAGDELDVRLQCTTDRVVWHTRARSAAFLGSLSPSSTAPEYQVLRICQTVDLSANEEVYEPDGSASATAVAVGQVVNGPFPGKYRDATLQKLMPNWRVRAALTDANSNASFVGTVEVHGICRAY